MPQPLLGHNFKLLKAKVLKFFKLDLLDYQKDDGDETYNNNRNGDNCHDDDDGDNSEDDVMVVMV